MRQSCSSYSCSKLDRSKHNAIATFLFYGLQRRSCLYGLRAIASECRYDYNLYWRVHANTGRSDTGTWTGANYGDPTAATIASPDLAPTRTTPITSPPLLNFQHRQHRHRCHRQHLHRQRYPHTASILTINFAANNSTQ